MKSKYLSIIVITTLMLGVSVNVASADRGYEQGKGIGLSKNDQKMFITSGTVSSVSGNNITINSIKISRGATSTVSYTINASNAKILKNNASSTVSSIVVGDKLFVQGNLNGSTITAKMIRVGEPQMLNKGRQPMGGSIIQGNGQPIIASKVTAVNGNTFTITNRGTSTYSIDATNAVVQKQKATSSE